MNDKLIIDILNGWKQDKQVIDIEGLIDYLQETGRFYHFKGRMKTFLANFNKAASDAMWDGQTNKAVMYLKRYDLNERNDFKRPKRIANYISNTRDSGKFLSPTTDWKYVKKTRSRT